METHQPTEGIWMSHMKKGAFEEAWQESDHVLEQQAGKPCWHLPRHLQHIWNGSSLQGKKVLIRCYHGLGDTLQFIRYVPMVKAIASKVIVWAQAPLIPVLQSMKEIDVLLPLHDGTPDVSYDVDVEVMELPHIFRTTLARIPNQVPYLEVAPMFLTDAHNSLNVGIVWKAGDWDTRRSLSFKDLEPLSNVSNIGFHIMQAQAEAAGWDGTWGNLVGDKELYEYAQIISGLDMLITVDSMPAHLAGAMGVPVWTMLHAEADWRWMEQRSDSPWYPSMRLFRQKTSGSWTSLVAEVKDALQEWVRRQPLPAPQP